jgi:hypothetical protein
MKTSFIRQFFKFVDTDEYIQIIFVDPKTDKYKVIFVSLVQALMNICAVQFDFNRPHIVVDGATSLINICGLYSSVM